MCLIRFTLSVTRPGRFQNSLPCCMWEKLNAFWINQSFHNYADYALSAEFHDGLARLVSLGRERQCAVMCSEALWWRCHRRIVADYLISRGESVFHLMSHDKVVPAKLTDGVRAGADGMLVYPPSQPSA